MSFRDGLGKVQLTYYISKYLLQFSFIKIVYNVKERNKVRIC